MGRSQVIRESRQCSAHPRKEAGTDPGGAQRTGLVSTALLLPQMPWLGWPPPLSSQRRLLSRPDCIPHPQLLEQGMGERLKGAKYRFSVLKQNRELMNLVFLGHAVPKLSGTREKQTFSIKKRRQKQAFLT